MTDQLIPGHRTDPFVSINDPAFVYTPAAKTDLEQTFARVRARLAEEAKKTQAPAQEKVRQLRRK